MLQFSQSGGLIEWRRRTGHFRITSPVFLHTPIVDILVIHLPIAKDAIRVAIGVVVERESGQVPLLALLLHIVKLLMEKFPLATACSRF